MNKFGINKLDGSIVLLNIEKYALSKIFYFLVNSMFYNHGKFISYTDTRYICNLMQYMIYTYTSDASLTGGL